MKNIAINGFGRIGRLVFRELIEKEGFNIVAINDLTDAEQLAYLLKYDTNHRLYNADVISFDGDYLVFKDKKIRVYREKDAINLPWRELNVDAVIECSGYYTKEEEARKHIEAGAKHVIISAPGKGNMKTIVYGVNDEILDGSEEIISAASCTTNCLAPVLKVLCDNFGVSHGYMSTVHAFTNDQTTLDIAHKKGINSRRGRAASMNIIPTSTGAATAIGKVIPELNGKMNGNAFRVPVSDGSMVDLTLILNKKVTVEEINNTFKENQSEALKFTMDPIVSSDIIGSRVGAVVDGMLTDVLTTDEGDLVKVVAWYDNEMGYTAQLIRTTVTLLNK